MINFYKQNKYLFIFIAVFILVFIILFIVFYGKYDLFKFPFNSNVWGNAADWTMVIVTIITAIYLINTFLEQKRSNEIQIKKELESILPIFKIQKSSLDSSPHLDYSDCSHYLKIILTKNDVRNLKFTIHDSKIIFNALDRPYVEVGEVTGFELNQEITSGYDNEKHCILEMHFQDVKYNRYKQLAYISNNTVFFESPILIK